MEIRERRINLAWLRSALPSFVKRMPVGNHALLLLVIVALGFFLRLRGLDRAGFNEDEINKVVAARAYLHGDFTLNREHPMLMKSMIAASLAATDSWNRYLGRSHKISEEVAVRLPNVVFGSLTAVVIFLLANELFGAQIALLSAFFWSVGTIAIIDNRLAKEDTLLVFFAWLAFYLFYRAKTESAVNVQVGWKWYAAAGGSLGLMLASKYFPHYLGILFLYWYLRPVRGKYPPFRRQEYLSIFGACGVTFLLADPVILLPSTIKYMLYYVGQGTVTHHGYLMMGNFYFNDPAHFLHGMPLYFYGLLLAVKTPIPVLLALAVGLVEVGRRRREAGSLFFLFMFLIWLVPFSLVSTKWLRWMLSWMPSVYVIAAIGAARILSWTSEVSRTKKWPQAIPQAAILTSVMLMALPLLSVISAGPFYSLYLNPLGLHRTGFYFPHEEWADIGLRPAIRRICQEAAHGATVGGEAPPVFAYYLQKFGRSDLHYVDLSDLKQETSPTSAYLVIEDGRKYTENIAFVRTLESDKRPIWVIAVGPDAAARVYREANGATHRPPLNRPKDNLPNEVSTANPLSLLRMRKQADSEKSVIAMRAVATIKIQLEE